MPEVDEETVNLGRSARVSLVEVEETVTAAKCDGELLDVDLESSHGVNIETAFVTVFAVPFELPFNADRPCVGFDGRAF